MKSFASKFNKTTFGIDTTNFIYTKLGDLYKEGGRETVRNVDGVYVHKSQLGDSPVIIDAHTKMLVNLPSHTAEVIREILADNEAVDTIKAGKVGYTIYEYESHGKKCYSISFVDM